MALSKVQRIGDETSTRRKGEIQMLFILLFATVVSLLACSGESETSVYRCGDLRPISTGV